MTDNYEYLWPMEFPENVPSKECKPAKGKAYRLVNRLPPTADDFLMYRQEKHFRPQPKSKEEFTYGVSLWLSAQSIEEVIKKYPSKEQFGDKKIVWGELNPKLGVISQTKKDGHLTLWKQQGAMPHLHINRQARQS